MISSISSAMSGMASAVTKFDRASARIAQAGDPTSAPGAGGDDLIGDRVDQITAAHAFAANIATVRTADDMLGTLINTVA